MIRRPRYEMVPAQKFVGLPGDRVDREAVNLCNIYSMEEN